MVVSNAGYGLFGAAEEPTDEQIRHQIDTNLIGSIQVVLAVLPYLRGHCCIKRLRDHGAVNFAADVHSATVTRPREASDRG